LNKTEERRYFMANINDYEANLDGLLLGLVDTDEDIIAKLNSLQNEIDTVENKVSNDIKEEINTLEDKVARGSGSYAILDINAPGITGNGVLKDDLQASDKKCYSYTSDGATTQLIYSASFSDVKFGHYAICIRAKTNTIGGNDLVRLEIKNTDEVINSTTFTGDQFGKTSGYSYLYTTFEYDVSNNNAKNLIFNLYSLPVSGVEISFDYVYISMIIPAIFL
jgi:hypothetical protein